MLRRYAFCVVEVLANLMAIGLRQVQRAGTLRELFDGSELAKHLKACDFRIDMSLPRRSPRDTAPTHLVEALGHDETLTPARCIGTLHNTQIDSKSNFGTLS